MKSFSRSQWSPAAAEIAFPDACGVTVTYLSQISFLTNGDTYRMSYHLVLVVISEALEAGAS